MPLTELVLFFMLNKELIACSEGAMKFLISLIALYISNTHKIYQFHAICKYLFLAHK